MASGSSDQCIKIWDLADGVEVLTLTGHEQTVRSLLVVSSTKLISGSEDKTIRVWNIQNETTETSVLKGHNSWVSNLVLLKDHNTLASSSWDRTINLWDISNCELVKTLDRHSDRVNSIALTDDNTLISVSQDKTIIVWK